MKTQNDNRATAGFTLMELLLLMALIAILASLMFSLASFSNTKPRAQRIQCVNNLRQIGISARVWKGDQTVTFPMSVRETNGGTMEFITGPNVWRHFQVMSNELSTPKILLCPADASRAWAATNFNFFSNSNLSYFIGLNASDSDPQSLLSGDRNITNGTPIRNGILELTTHNPTGWTAEMHNHVGNLLLSDGSVQQVSQTGLRDAVENSGTFTNRLQMPILGP